MKLLNLLNEERKVMDEKTKIMEEGTPDKADLVRQKEILDYRIKRMERKHTDDKIKDSLRKLEDLTHAVSDMQLSLNLIWKRAKQVEEDLKQSLEIV